MTEQQPLNMASPSAASPDMELMHADFQEVGAASTSHNSTHLALLYETQTELFASAVPFLQAGLNRGEQCLYIADETPLPAVVEALETAGIDVDAARKAGDLLLASPAETSLTDGEFHPAEMIELLDEHIDDATTTEDDEQLRIAGELPVSLAADHSVENLLEYEAALTEFFATRDSLAMCMYDREKFPAAVLDDVLQHHPQVVVDGTVMQNVYYVPHDEEHPQQTVERKLQTFRERKRREQLQNEQTQLLERIAAGAPLEECLSALCSSVSRLKPGTRASILLADEEREAFHRSIAPDLRPSWAERWEGASINELMIGTCDEAVFSGTSVTCENVETDDRWAEDWRNLCVANGILAGHSAPIQDEDGDPLGSFMLCFDEPKAPTEWEKRLADFGTHIASIAIERERSHRSLHDSEERLRLALEVGETGVWELDLQTNDAPNRSPRHDEIFGYEEREDWSYETFLDHVHPDDRDHVEARFEDAFQTGELNVESRIIRADDEQRWITVHGEFYDDDEGESVRAIGTVQDITDRKEREHRLARRREQIETLQNRVFDTSPMGIVVVDSTNEVTLANDRAADILGIPRDELTGLSYDTSQFDFVDTTGEPLSDTDLPFERIRTTGDSVFGVEVGINPDGHRIWLSINAAPLSDEQANEPTETVVAFEDITDHKRANEALEHLNNTSRDLMNAETQAINERAAGITQEVLDIPYASLWRYDEATGDLQLHTASTASGIDAASIRSPEEFTERAWQTFVSTELDASNELPPASDSASSEESIRSGVIVPLGRHGVICAGSLSPGAFDETTVDLAETIGATIETALDRAGDEQQLARQNEELTRLNRINDIIREIDQALVQAETREEIDRVVCEQLSKSDLYEFAWIGETDLETDTIVPREWAGIDPGYLDSLTITTDDTPTGQGPIGTALRTRELQVVQDIITASRFAPWREHTLEQDVRSCISIPLVYNDALYGVLTVYAAEPLTNERHQDVLAELGETVANAISSAETKQALQTDSVVELNVQFYEPDTVLSRLAQQVSCQIEFEGLVSHSAETSQVFITTRGASADEICTAATDSLAIETVTTLSESEDGCRFKLVMADPPLASVLIDQDAEIQQLTLDADGATAVIDLPTTRDVRSVIETIQTTVPETDLVSRRTSHRSREPLYTCRAVYENNLTDRQQDTLRTAYLSGFFESPRGTTGQEIADAMDVSQPTFVQHLRAGQRNLFEMLYDGSE